MGVLGEAASTTLAILLVVVAGWALVQSRRARAASRELRERLDASQRAEEQLRAQCAQVQATLDTTLKSQQLLHTIVDNSMAVIYVKDLAGRYLLVNRRYEEIFHVNRAGVLGKTDYDMFSKADADAFRAMDERVASASRTLTEEETVPQDDAPHTYVSVKSPLRDADGKTYAVFGISTDITDRKRVEWQLRRHNQTLELLNRVSSALVAELDLEKIVQVVTDAGREVSGAAFGAFFYNSRNEQGEPYMLYTLSGAPREAFSAFPLPRATALFALTFRAEGVVRIADVLVDPRYGKSAPHYGMPRGHLPVRSYLAVPVVSRSGEVLGGLFFGHPEPNKFSADAEMTMVGLAAQAAIAIDNAKLHGALQREVERYRQTEHKLQIQVERLALLDQITRAIGQRQNLRSVFQVLISSLEDSLPIDFGCVCLYDAALEQLSVACVGPRSAALAEQLALGEQAQIPIDQNGLGRCVRGQLVYERVLDQLEVPFPRRFAQAGLGSLVAAPLSLESKVFGILVVARRKADGFSSDDCEFLRQLSEHVALALHQVQMYEALRQAYDDLHQTQQSAIQQERLRALGQMASGIAHDINNALSPVAVYTDLLLERETDLSARTREYLETTQRAIGDVAQTVARMAEFYRLRETEQPLKPVELNLLIAQVLELTRARWSDMPQQRGSVIQVRAELAAELPPVDGVESELREALVNLIFNAVDAMPEGGSLALRTCVQAPSAAPLLRRVHVEVEDSGVGMDDETRRRCLEPFFTTKGERGTGLGLAMVFGVVRRHDAEVEIESAPGKGTLVRLLFPAASAAHGQQSAQPRALVAPLRILLVDDDPLILRSLRVMLEGDGHAVSTADGGQRGIDAAQAAEAGQPFDLVITDLGMPGVDGRRVAAAVKALRASLPVILLTGWGRSFVAGDAPQHVDRVLSKPPKPEELRGALAGLMARAAPAAPG